MRKYPMSKERWFKDFELLNGEPIDDKCREMFSIIIDMINQAYEDGRQDCIVYQSTI